MRILNSNNSKNRNIVIFLNNVKIGVSQNIVKTGLITARAYRMVFDENRLPARFEKIRNTMFFNIIDYKTNTTYQDCRISNSRPYFYVNGLIIYNFVDILYRKVK